jgi:hypothetical protein
MPSPFPGVHPYLEQADVQRDLYQSFTLLLRQLLRSGGKTSGSLFFFSPHEVAPLMEDEKCNSQRRTASGTEWRIWPCGRSPGASRRQWLKSPLGPYS